MLRKSARMRCSRVALMVACLLGGGCGGTVANQAITYGEPVPDPELQVDIYVPSKVWSGTTVLGDNRRRDRPRIIEIDMQGRVVWEYVLPLQLRPYTNPGFDVELLPNNHILFVLPRKGVFEIDRAGTVVWSHLDRQVSHDADRLPNGNTLYVFGADDQQRDAQVKEVDRNGTIVWSWYARDEFDKPSYQGTYEQGWTHTNAVTRLAHGHTLISLRNFNVLLEVDHRGRAVRRLGAGYLRHPHDPALLPNGHILVANHVDPQEIVEIDPRTDAVVWRFAIPEWRMWPVRDADRLPNGNTLITGTTALLEITADKEIVWRLRWRNVPFRSRRDAPALGFYKAQRTAE